MNKDKLEGKRNDMEYTHFPHNSIIRFANSRTDTEMFLTYTDLKDLMILIDDVVRGPQKTV